LNYVPLLFAPGTAGLGYLIGSGPGAVIALGAWAVVVGLATAAVVLRRVDTASSSDD
jgi:hypothetical protein